MLPSGHGPPTISPSPAAISLRLRGGREDRPRRRHDGRGGGTPDRLAEHGPRAASTSSPRHRGGSLAGWSMAGMSSLARPRSRSTDSPMRSTSPGSMAAGTWRHCSPAIPCLPGARCWTGPSCPDAATSALRVRTVATKDFPAPSFRSEPARSTIRPSSTSITGSSSAVKHAAPSVRYGPPRGRRAAGDRSSQMGSAQ